MIARKIAREANMKLQNQLAREQLGTPDDEDAFEPDSNPESFENPESSFIEESDVTSSMDWGDDYGGVGSHQLAPDTSRKNILNKKKESEKSRLLKIKSISKRIMWLDFANISIALAGIIFAQADADVFETKNFIDMKELKRLALELSICVIHSPPYFGTEKVFFEYRQIGGRIRYPLDTFIFLFMMARLYLIIRVLRHFSLFNYEYTDRFINKEDVLESK